MLCTTYVYNLLKNTRQFEVHSVSHRFLMAASEDVGSAYICLFMIIPKHK